MAGTLMVSRAARSPSSCPRSPRRSKTCRWSWSKTPALAHSVRRRQQVAGAATEINGVQHAYPLTGPYDVIVRAEARDIDALGQLVVSRIQAINGVTRTLTCPVVHL